MIEDLSGFVDRNKKNPLKVSNIACGLKHAVVTFDYGAFYIWGDNEFGQLGDRKRRVMESPFPKSKFELKHNVLNVCAGETNTAVVVERLPEAI
jgi:alpha-tubulin suppressor-like RCC1 family protein